jgi:flagellar M-ring protein FliF
VFETLREQFQKFWENQSTAQKISLIALVAAAVIITAVLAVNATQVTYAVAYQGLADQDAGVIVQKLGENSIDYQLEGNGTILVPSDQVHEVRLMMAREGLPQQGTVGFELFDTTKLGVTEFTQQVNYQRALEGELERTIASMDVIDNVRVHIVTPEKALLSSDQEPATASVTIATKLGSQLTQSHVRSITYLVASSVEGLHPENVVIIDTNGNLLAVGSADGSNGVMGMAVSQQDEYQRSVESDVATQIKRNVQNLLDSVFGPNKSVVQVSVVLDWTQRETYSETYDPTPAAIRSEQTINESYTTNQTEVGGVPGASSNLPTPVATLQANGSPVYYNHEEETRNYEISKTEYHETVSPGAIKRLSVSVLVDGISDPNQLNTLQEAVAAAAGIDEARGDYLVVDALAFDRSYFEEQTAVFEQETQTDFYLQIGLIAGGVLLLFILLWYIARLFKNLRVSSSSAWDTVMQPVSQMAMQEGAPIYTSAPVSTMTSMASSMMDQGMSFDYGEEEETPMEEIPLPKPKKKKTKITPEEEQMQRILRQLAEESPSTVAEVIQLWLAEDEK